MRSESGRPSRRQSPSAARRSARGSSSTSRCSSAPRSSGWGCSRRCFSEQCSPSSSRTASCAATPSAACSNRSSCAPWAGPRRRPPGGARGRGGRPRGPLPRRLGLPLGGCERDRRVHDLRRRARGRLAGSDRRGAQLGQPEDDRQRVLVGASVRGALPRRVERDHRRHGRLHARRVVPRTVRRSAGCRKRTVPLRSRLSRRPGGSRPARFHAARSLTPPGEERPREQAYSEGVWELVRTLEEDVRSLEDDERASAAFLWLGGAGILTWFATLAVADSLLPATSLASLMAVIIGVVGWRAARQGEPRETSTVVAIVLAVILGLVWLYLVLAVIAKIF